LVVEALPLEPELQRYVKISAAMARQRFHGCDPDYIRDVCHAACCRTKANPHGMLVTIHPSEREAIEQRGGKVVGSFLQPAPGAKGCPFQRGDDHLCSLHHTADKPFGCIASPFTLNKNDTLVVRNRYRMLVCYKDRGPTDKEPLPAYRAFGASLRLIFGPTVATLITEQLDNGSGDLTVPIPERSYRMLKDNDAAKHNSSL
jgi:hypothetical protein